MKKSLQHMLYATICVVSVIIGLLVLWWVTSKPYTEENFISLMPHIVMIGLTSSGDVYYADIDVPMQPKWIKSSLSNIGDIAGSYGQLYTVTRGGSVPKYGAYDSSTQTSMSGTVTATQIAVDDMNAVAGVNGTVYRYSPTLTGGLAVTPGGMNSIAISGGFGYWVGSDGKLQYASSPSRNNYIETATGADWKQVTYDAGTVCAIKNNGELWCADTNVESLSANFTKQGTRLFNSINLKEGRIVGVGTDGKVYYSNSYAIPKWSEVATQPYTTAGTTTGTPVAFSKVILIYPGLNSRRKRFKGSAAKCNSNEELIDGYCYQACPSGRAAVGKTCPFKVKYIPAISSCPAGNDFINDSCYKPCGSGYVANGIVCDGTTTTKGSSAINTAGVSPERYSCPANGVLSGRYVRVRPTTLISNNKLCISALNVNGVDGSNLIPVGAKAFATDGTCIETPIGGGTCPPAVSSYISGATYDREVDGGKIKRSANLYWEVDLGSIKQIKSIGFVGCNYIANNSSPTTTTPGSDQITGMKIEVLFNSNKPGTYPVATRTLGPEKSQTITFDYSTTDPKMPNRCYDVCPKINGIVSTDNGDQSCFAAAGGITHRSVSVPVELYNPVCGPVTTPTGDIATIAAVTTTGAQVSLRNWKVDPSNDEYVLSCDILPGSVLKPVNTSVRVFRQFDFTADQFFEMFKLPTSGAAAYSRSTTVLPTVEGQGLEGSTKAISWTNVPSDNSTSYVCIVDSGVTCDSGFTYQAESSACIQDFTTMANITVKVPEIQLVA